MQQRTARKLHCLEKNQANDMENRVMVRMKKRAHDQQNSMQRIGFGK